MDELINYNGYEEFKQAVNRVLNRTVEDFVLTGYLLKQARDTDILQGSGYNNVNEFAWGEYKLDVVEFWALPDSTQCRTFRPAM